MYSAWLERFPVCYLLNVDILRESVPKLLGLPIESSLDWSNNLGRWQNYDDATLDLNKHACELQRQIGSADNIAAMTQSAEKSLDPDQSQDALKFSRLVFPLVDAHPEIKFVFFFPPLFVTEFWRLAVSENSPKTYQFLKQELLKRAHVELFDFQMHHSLTQHTQFFADLYHGNSGVAARMALAMNEGQFRITSLESNKEELKRELHDAGPHLRSYFEHKCGA